MILGKGSSTQSMVNEFENVDYSISTEACGYTSIISDATEELASLESALYVADVMLEEKALEGATENEMEVLLEGVMTSVYGRLKDVLKKLIAKIKQWFANVKKFFQVLFTHGKDFAKKYKTDIVKAASRVKGYKYKTYNFAKGWKDLLEAGEIEKITGEAGAKENIAIADDYIAKHSNVTSNTELTKIYLQEEVWEDRKIESQAEFNKAFKEQLYGGSLEKEEFEDFNKGPSIQDMLAVLEQGSKVLGVLDKAQKVLQSNCDKTITAIEKAENEAAKNIKKGETLSKRYSVATEICKGYANALISVADIYKEALKTAMRDAETILKGLLRHKPAKEGFEGEDFLDQSESILESALRLI